MTPEYEQGYRDGMEHISNQVSYLNEQVQRVTEILTKAVFVNPVTTPPKPGMHVWLVMDKEMISTGYFLGGQYLADSGYVVDPLFWCMIPKVIAGEDDGPRRKLVKRD